MKVRVTWIESDGHYNSERTNDLNIDGPEYVTVDSKGYLIIRAQWGAVSRAKAQFAPGCWHHYVVMRDEVVPL